MAVVAAASKGYSLSSTQSCLQKAGYQATAIANRSLPGTGGNLRVHLAKGGPALLAPNNTTGRVLTGYVFLVFQDDPAAALATENKAVAKTVQTLKGMGALITRTAVKNGVGLAKNVFYYSASGPLTSDQRTKVTTCLH